MREYTCKLIQSLGWGRTVEHEAYVYSDDEMRALSRKLIDRTLQLKRLLEGAVDVLEPYEATRLPESYVAAVSRSGLDMRSAGAAASAAHMMDGESEESECAVRIQAAMRGHHERLRVARMRAERRQAAEEARSAVVIQSAARGHMTRKRLRPDAHGASSGSGFSKASGEGSETSTPPGVGSASVTEQRERLARRQVQGLRAGGEAVVVRASGDASAAEVARTDVVEATHGEEARRAQAEAEAERDRRARVGSPRGASRDSTLDDADAAAAAAAASLSPEEAARAAAAVKIQALQRGRSARKSLAAHKGSSGAARSKPRPDDQSAAATKIQALQRGRAARRKLKEEQERRQAAEKIQALARGRHARRHVAQMRDESTIPTE